MKDFIFSKQFVFLAVLFLVWTYFLSVHLAKAQGDSKTIKLGTLTITPKQPFSKNTPTQKKFPTKPPPADSIPNPTNPPASGNPIPVTTPAIGGPIPPTGYYCIDDVDPDMCDDNTSHLVPKGAGGIAGSCGTVIEQAHKLVDLLPKYMKGLRDKLEGTVSNCGYSTGPENNYVSTHFVIDAYNLAGFKDLSKTNPNHVSPSGMFNWWRSAGSGYQFIPYSPSVVKEFGEGTRDLTGCVMFLKTGSSYHIGVVNKLELYTANGDGVISILQAGTRMYVDRFPVSGWNIRNSSTNQTVTGGVSGFGCR